jgi:hypothetical protein
MGGQALNAIRIKRFELYYHVVCKIQYFFCVIFVVSEYMISIFDFFKTKMEMLQVFIKTEEEDEKEDVAAQYTGS